MNRKGQASIELILIATITITLSFLLITKIIIPQESVFSIANYRQELIKTVNSLDTKYYVEDLNYLEQGNQKKITILMDRIPNGTGSDPNTDIGKICAAKEGIDLVEITDGQTTQNCT